MAGAMLEVAAAMGLGGRGVRCEPHELRGLARPAILHWDLNHFMVPVAVSGAVQGLSAMTGPCSLPSPPGTAPRPWPDPPWSQPVPIEAVPHPPRGRPETPANAAKCLPPGKPCRIKTRTGAPWRTGCPPYPPQNRLSAKLLQLRRTAVPTFLPTFSRRGHHDVGPFSALGGCRFQRVSSCSESFPRGLMHVCRGRVETRCATLVGR